MSQENIIINEVGPRDGLQSQAKHLTLQERVLFAQSLLAAGIKHMEVGSFVSPKAVPQMAGTDALLKQLQSAHQASFTVLVPNMKGYELAIAAGAKTVAVVASATETMNQKNINMSLTQTFEVSRQIIERGRAEGKRVQAYLAVAFECPFEGQVALDTVLQQADALKRYGADEIVIADTIGAANPAAVKAMMSALVADHGSEKLACHFHDTRALGLANIYAAIESGVRKFDSSIGGLGGCPFAPGAKGNVATEDVVMLCDQMGFSTGIVMPKLLEAVAVADQLTGNCAGGRAHYWLSNNAKKMPHSNTA